MTLKWVVVGVYCDELKWPWKCPMLSFGVYGINIELYHHTLVRILPVRRNGIMAFLVAHNNLTLSRFAVYRNCPVCHCDIQFLAVSSLKDVFAFFFWDRN
jgi:hypothetical protein